MRSSSIKCERFGSTPGGEPVDVYTLQSPTGLRLRAINYGAIVLNLDVPRRSGGSDDVVLGFETFEPYLSDSAYLGAVVGRYANRIADGRFALNGQSYSLAVNNAPGGVPCALHGGVKGFNRVLWRAEIVDGEGGPGVRFSYLSEDGEEGYPGDLDVSVTYRLTADNGWRIDYSAKTSRETPVNLTQHSFFNLKGEGRGDVLDHELKLESAEYTPVNAAMIPTGKIAPVAGTPLDFTSFVPLRERVISDFEQIQMGNGVDHNFVLRPQSDLPVLAATVYEPTSGRTLEVWTTEPAIQVYTGNFLDGSIIGKSGSQYGFREGFCLETQHFPDSPNQPHFPNTVLRPGEEFRSTTVYKFGFRG